MTHTHRCQCGAAVGCGAPLVKLDGFQYVCMMEAENHTFFCEECEEHGVCEDCGKATAGNEEFPFVCDACAVIRRENQEPAGEPDYDGVSASERMDDAYRINRSQR